MNTRHVLGRYARSINIPVVEITGKSRKQDTCIARQCFCKVMIEMDVPIHVLVDIFNLHRSTIREGISHVNDLLSVNDKYVIFCLETCRKLVLENY